MSLTSHHARVAYRTEYLTPPGLLTPLGAFDLDPCAPEPQRRPWSTAARHYDITQDGLAQPWHGRVWLNPPFGDEAATWLARLVEHGNGIALVPARTETQMFAQHVWGAADVVCFLHKRPHFHLCCGEWVPHKRAKGGRVYVAAGEALPFNSGVPMCLIAYGAHNAHVLDNTDAGVTVRWQRKSH